MQQLSLLKVDYFNEKDMSILIKLLQMYANDPMGGGEAIDEQTIQKLPKAMQARDYLHSFIVFSEDTPIGFANCIESFSTFAATSILNIHDFAIIPSFRGQDISLYLMNGIEQFAKMKGYSKITLEVLEGNKSAVRAYEKAGFHGYQLSPEYGKAMFWQKYIS